MTAPSPAEGGGPGRPDVVIAGRGRVGRTLARAARSAGLAVRLVEGHGDAPLAIAPLVVLSVPDADVARVAGRLPDVRRASAVVHTAGILPVDHLASLRGRGWSVGQAHPLVAVASPRTRVEGATLLVGGDALAVRRATSLARRIAMRPLVAPDLDRALWHAIAALVANGSSALVCHGAALLERGGVPPRAGHAAMVGLLASVARSVAELGTPGALTGPVRRGDATAVERHLRALSAADPSGEVVRLYASLAGAQVGLARAIGEASDTGLARIAEVTSAGGSIAGASAAPGRSRRPSRRSP